MILLPIEKRKESLILFKKIKITPSKTIETKAMHIENVKKSKMIWLSRPAKNNV